MKTIKNIAIVLIATLLLVINSVSNIHALLHNEHQQDDKYSCHNKHFETKHHHCELDTFTLAFDAPTAFILSLTTPTQHYSYTTIYASYTPLVIHYLFALKAPPKFV
ncbi:MAG: hypothetical protein H7331_11695 [Bacteroidia bacterium]|nr:hypothetical protein [Bacteroidia bacterium]